MMIKRWFILKYVTLILLQNWISTFVEKYLLKKQYSKYLMNGMITLCSSTIYDLIKMISCCSN